MRGHDGVYNLSIKRVRLTIGLPHLACPARLQFALFITQLKAPLCLIDLGAAVVCWDSRPWDELG